MVFLTVALYFLNLTMFIAQSYSVTHFDESVGFNASTVYNIVQDKLGFIWIGTNAGLIRYDGIYFESFDVQDGLIDLDVFKVQIDSSNHIFLHNFSGKPNFYYNGEFYNTYNDSTLSTFRMENDIITSIDKNDNAFILSAMKENYFYYFMFDQGKIVSNKRIYLAEGEEVVGIVSMDSFYYVFYVLENSDRIFYKIYRDTTLFGQGELGNLVNCLNVVVLGSELGFLDAQNKKRIIFYSVLPTGVLKKGREQTIDFSVKNLFSFNNDLWITLNEGGILKLKSSGAKEYFLQDKTVNNLLVDDNSNLWIGTQGDGMYYIQNHGVTNIGIDKLEISNRVISLCASNDNIIYAGFDKFSIAKIRGKEVLERYNLLNQLNLDSRRVVKIKAIEEDVIICGTDNGLINVSFKTSNKLEYTLYDRLLEGVVKDFETIDSNNLYIGRPNGLERFSYDKLPVREFDKRVISVAYDKDSTVWIGTLDGLFYKEPDFVEAIQFPIGILDEKKINDILVTQNMIYLATDSGVCFIDRNDHSRNYFILKSNGLSSNQCLRIKSYEGFLWVATSSGITKIKLDQNGNFSQVERIFNRDSGLWSNYINDLLVVRDTVWSATNKGISIFPTSYSQNVIDSKINIIEAKTSLGKLNIYDKILLKPNQNNISITFSNLNFRYDNLDQYEYRLLPNIDNWSKSTSNTVVFSELNPGSYMFEVRVMDQGFNSEQLFFEVEPSLHQTWYFKFIIVLAGLLLTMLVIRRRGESIKKRANFEKTVTQLELEAIKAQINPHFIYNCLTSIKTTIIKNENIKAEKQLSIFTKLIRQTLSHSQFNYISIEDEIEYLTNYLEMEKVRFKKKLNYTITMSKKNNDDDIHIPSMLVQPYVENAIKHGMPENPNISSDISIKFICAKKTINCIIEDNGPGILKTLASKNQKHKSYGMKLTSGRAEKYNRLFNANIQILVKEIETGGTRVIIQMPKNKEI